MDLAAEAQEQEKEAFVQWMLTKGLDPSEAFSDDEMEAIYKDYEGERSTIADQKAQAEVLRGASTGEGRSTNGIYAASGWGEMAGGLAQNYVGALGQRKAREEEGVLSDQNALARSSYARELAKAVQGAQQPNGPQGGPAISPEMQRREEERMRGLSRT